MLRAFAGYEIDGYSDYGHFSSGGNSSRETERSEIQPNNTEDSKRKSKLNRYRLRHKNKRLNTANLDSENEDVTCCICLESVKDSTKKNRMLNCGHVFHKDCIEGWDVERKACPICRL